VITLDRYVVKENDTIESIALLYQIPANEIIKANQLEAPYQLEVGQVLSIPDESYQVFNYYVVKEKDTLYQIASNNNISVPMLAAINGLDEDEFIHPGDTLLIPKQEYSVYLTKQGDTIGMVAQHFNTYAQDIVYSNRNIYLLPNQLIVYRSI